MNTEILNLRELFGVEYKIEFDEAAEPKTLQRKNPMYFEIHAKYGYFYPFDENRVAFVCTSKRVAKRLVKELGKQIQPYNGIFDDGYIGEESAILFEAESFKAVAEIVKAKKKRVVSEKRRGELAAQGRKNLNHGAKEGSSCT